MLQKKGVGPMNARQAKFKLEFMIMMIMSDRLEDAQKAAGSLFGYLDEQIAREEREVV